MNCRLRRIGERGEQRRNGIGSAVVQCRQRVALGIGRCGAKLLDRRDQSGRIARRDGRCSEHLLRQQQTVGLEPRIVGHLQKRRAAEAMNQIGRRRRIGLGRHELMQQRFGDIDSIEAQQRHDGLHQLGRRLGLRVQNRLHRDISRLWQNDRRGGASCRRSGRRFFRGLRGRRGLRRGLVLAASNGGKEERECERNKFERMRVRHGEYVVVRFVR